MKILQTVWSLIFPWHRINGIKEVSENSNDTDYVQLLTAKTELSLTADPIESQISVVACDMTRTQGQKTRQRCCHLNPHLNTRLKLLFTLSLTSCVWVILLNSQTQGREPTVGHKCPCQQLGEQPEASMERTQITDCYITASWTWGYTDWDPDRDTNQTNADPLYWPQATLETRMTI